VAAIADHAQSRARGDSVRRWKHETPGKQKLTSRKGSARKITALHKNSVTKLESIDALSLGVDVNSTNIGNHTRNTFAFEGVQGASSSFVFSSQVDNLEGSSYTFPRHTQIPEGGRHVGSGGHCVMAGAIHAEANAVHNVQMLHCQTPTSADDAEMVSPSFSD